MVAHFKNVLGGYITTAQKMIVPDGMSITGNITEDEYNEILSTIWQRPTPPEGFDYRLKEDLTWELCELPPIPEPEEPSYEELSEAVNIYKGGDFE